MARVLKEKSIASNIDMKYIVKEFIKFIICNHDEMIDSKLLTHLEYNIHCNNDNEYIYTIYTLLTLKQYLT